MFTQGYRVEDRDKGDKEVKDENVGKKKTK